MNTEQAFLNAILTNPADDTCKLVYADWLEERGDERGEFIRLMMHVRQTSQVTPEQRERHRSLSLQLLNTNTALRQMYQDAAAASQAAIEAGDEPPPRNPERPLLDQQRLELEQQLLELSNAIRRVIPPRLQELAAKMDANWLAVVSDPEVDSCHLGAGRAYLRMDFVCDRSWADMTPTDDVKVRHCGECKNNVYYCETMADVRLHAHEAHCVCLGIPRREGDKSSSMAMFGRPSKESLWDHQHAHGMDPVSEARLKAMPRAELEKRRGRQEIIWTEGQFGNFVSACGQYALRPSPKHHRGGQYDVYRLGSSNHPVEDDDGDYPVEVPGEWRQWKMVDKATRDYFGVAEKDRLPDGTWKGWI